VLLLIAQIFLAIRLRRDWMTGWEDISRELVTYRFIWRLP
jgi:hypothetical protein